MTETVLPPGYCVALTGANTQDKLEEFAKDLPHDRQFLSNIFTLRGTKVPVVVLSAFKNVCGFVVNSGAGHYLHVLRYSMPLEYI